MSALKLIVLSGPTGVGKTDLSIALAQRLGCPIVSADSRQVYREMPIGTAAPSPELQALVPHYFVGSRSVTRAYSAGNYEADATALLDRLFKTHSTLLLCGGSSLYIDAVCRGIDDIPEADPRVRDELMTRYKQEGLAPIARELQQVDPLYYQRVDPQNVQRVIHALEVYRTSGRPLSSFHTGQQKNRPFASYFFCLNRPREELYERINARVLQMINAGWPAEAYALMPLSHLNALNTVGYKELFDYFGGRIDWPETLRLIQRNTRHYARKQLSWIRRDGRYHYLDARRPCPDLIKEIETVIQAPVRSGPKEN